MKRILGITLRTLNVVLYIALVVLVAIIAGGSFLNIYNAIHESGTMGLLGLSMVITLGMLVWLSICVVFAQSMAVIMLGRK